MTIEQWIPAEQAALQRLVKEQTDRDEQKRQARVAELEPQIAAAQADLDAVAEQYRPQFEALSRELVRLQSEVARVARERDRLRAAMQGEQAAVRARLAELKSERKRAEGLYTPPGVFLPETEGQRQAREQMMEEIHRTVMKPDSRK